VLGPSGILGIGGMASREEILDTIRAVLGGRQREGVHPRDFASLVADRSTALRRRVDRAVAYARRGLKLEACGAALEEPSIFKEAHLFESPELKAWRAFCVKNRLPEPDSIAIDLVQELDEAVAETSQMRRVLARMRRLVLADAPTWERLEVLRDLIKGDPGNPAWRQDLADLEPVAVSDLCERFELDMASNDLVHAEARLRLLEDGRWASSMAARKAADLREKFDGAQATIIGREAAELVLRLETERIAENEVGVRDELESLRALGSRLATHRGVLPDDLRIRASEVEAWLLDRDASAADRRENEDRVADLARLADDESVTLASLRSALQTAERTAAGVPDDLAVAVNRRIDLLEGRRRVRRAMAIASVVVLVAAACVGAYVALRGNERDLRLDAVAASIRSSVESDRLDEAARQLAEAMASADTAADPRIVDAQQRLRAALDRESARAERFKALMVEAGDPAGDSARPSSVDEAIRIIKTADDSQVVKDWKRRYEAAVASRRESRAEEGIRLIGAVRSEVAATQPSADLAWAGRLARWQSELEGIQRRYEDLPRVKSEAEGARKLVDEVRERVNKLQSEASRSDRLARLGESAGSIEALLAAMEGYRREFSDTPEAKEMAQAMESVEAWRALEAWGKINPRPREGLAVAREREREAALRAVEEYRDSHESMPDALLAHCNSVQVLLSAVPGWREALEQRLAQREFKFWYIQLDDGTRRYMDTNPEIQPWEHEPGSGLQKTVTWFLGEVPRERREFRKIYKSRVKAEGLSPQAALAKRLRSLLDDPKSSPNDVEGILGSLSVIVGAEDVDGKLSASLAKSVVSKLYSSMPATPLADKLNEAGEALARLEPDGGPLDTKWDWMNPDSKIARERSDAAQRTLRALVRPEEWRKEYLKLLEDASRPFATRYRPAGVIRRLDGQPSFQQSPGRTLAVGAELIAIPPGDAGSQPRMPVIGKVGQGGVVLNDVAALLPTGSLVFDLEGPRK
jgi:hypothetical protein